jgi:hypothetical protein
MKEKIKNNFLFFIYLVPVATNITGKAKIIRLNSAKLRKPSVRMKDGARSKNFNLINKKR